MKGYHISSTYYEDQASGVDQGDSAANPMTGDNKPLMHQAIAIPTFQKVPTYYNPVIHLLFIKVS